MLEYPVFVAVSIIAFAAVLNRYHKVSAAKSATSYTLRNPPVNEIPRSPPDVPRDEPSRDRASVNELLGEYDGTLSCPLVGATPPSTTIYRLLAPHTLPRLELKEEYGDFINIATRLLGASPGCYPAMALWPPALRCYNLMIPRYVNAPLNDLGLDGVGPVLRRIVNLNTSLEYRCGYCAAHCSAMGDSIRGPFQRQFERSTGDMRALMEQPIISAEDERATKTQSAAIRLVRAASRIPSAVTPEMQEKVEDLLGAKGLLLISGFVTMMGWLNAFMDTWGSDLEGYFLEVGSKQLGQADWDPAKHMSSKDPHPDADPASGDDRDVGLTGTLRSIWRTSSIERRWLQGFPATGKDLDELLRVHFGFVPKYLRALHNHLSGYEATVVLMYNFLFRDSRSASSFRAEDDGILGEAPVEWSREDKSALWYVYSTLTRNRLLQAHSAILAIRFGNTVHKLQNLVKGAIEGSGTRIVATSASKKLDVATALVAAISHIPSTVTDEMAHTLLSSCETAGGCVELLSSLSLFHALHRLSSVVAKLSDGFEDSVREFSGTEAGQALGIEASKPWTGVGCLGSS